MDYNVRIYRDLFLSGIIFIFYLLCLYRKIVIEKNLIN